MPVFQAQESARLNYKSLESHYSAKLKMSNEEVFFNIEIDKII